MFHLTKEEKFELPLFELNRRDNGNNGAWYGDGLICLLLGYLTPLT